MVKLGNTGRLSGGAAPVADIPDMNGAGTSTEQYLPNDNPSLSQQAFVSENGGNANSVVAETAMLVMNALPEEERQDDGYSAYDNPFISAQEAGRQLESYDRTVEAYDEGTLRRTTHTFG